jgi:hypothetical protein
VIIGILPLVLIAEQHLYDVVRRRMWQNEHRGNPLIPDFQLVHGPAWWETVVGLMGLFATASLFAAWFVALLLSLEARAWGRLALYSASVLLLVAAFVLPPVPDHEVFTYSVLSGVDILAAFCLWLLASFLVLRPVRMAPPPPTGNAATPGA